MMSYISSGATRKIVILRKKIWKTMRDMEMASLDLVDLVDLAPPLGMIWQSLECQAVLK